MTELFDVLNERGEYTDKTATRDECHKSGLRHRAVVIFIVSPDNQRVLLQKRSNSKKTWPGLWDITAGGHVDAGEFGYQAVLREAKEEIGLDFTPQDLLFIGSSTSENIFPNMIDRHVNEFYIVHADLDPSTLTLQPEEVQDIRWFDRAEVAERLHNNYDGITNKQGCWEYLLRYLNKVNP